MYQPLSDLLHSYPVLQDKLNKRARLVLITNSKRCTAKAESYKAAIETKLIKLDNLSCIRNNLCNKR